MNGIPAYAPPTVEQAPWTRPASAQIILENSGALIQTGGGKAFYSPSTDHIQLPPDNAFRGPPEFPATALHELAIRQNEIAAFLRRRADLAQSVASSENQKPLAIQPLEIGVLQAEAIQIEPLVKDSEGSSR